jgi:flagellar assembly protein FliH
VKISLSRLFRGLKNPELKIGSFRMEEVQGGLHEIYNQGGTGAGCSGMSSVATWDLPHVDQEENIPEQKENFKDRIARLEKEAYEKGFEQGQKDGFALEKRKLEEVRKQIEDMFISLRDLKPKIFIEAEGEILKLVMLIVRKVIGHEIKINSAVIVHSIKSAMKFLTDKRKVRIILNPDDSEEVKKILPDLSAVAKGGFFQVSEDRSVDRGGCILETGFGKINACIDDQLAALEEEIERQYQTTK